MIISWLFDNLPSNKFLFDIDNLCDFKKKKKKNLPDDFFFLNKIIGPTLV
jgi:hypothetical protein